MDLPKKGVEQGIKGEIKSLEGRKGFLNKFEESKATVIPVPQKTGESKRRKYIGRGGIALLVLVVILLVGPFRGLSFGTAGIGIGLLEDPVGNAAEIQKEVDTITQKVLAKQTLTDDEEKFTIDLYKTIGIGAKTAGLFGFERGGLPVSGEYMLAYIGGKGGTLETDEDIFVDSPIVQRAMRSMEATIIERAAISESGTITSQTPMLPQYLNYDKEGQIKDGIILPSEFVDADLFYSFHQFMLVASYERAGNYIDITWSVSDIYDFNNPEEMSTFSDFPIPRSGGKRIRIDDGLSYGLAHEPYNIARTVKMYSEWDTTISIS